MGVRFVFLPTTANYRCVYLYYNYDRDCMRKKNQLEENKLFEVADDR